MEEYVKIIVADNINDLVVKGLNNIEKNGYKIQALRSGRATQDFGVNYILLNPRNRVHNLRKENIKYSCRELLSYFNGTLKASNGLGIASKFWLKLADEKGNINSNYGYYVFYEKTPKHKNQYEWIINELIKSKDSRRAIININQSYHKLDTKDFPCTIAIQYYIKDDKLFSVVLTRSTDIVTGLPYDMCFFSLVHELVYSSLKKYKYDKLGLGHITMRSFFTQVYDRALEKAEEMKSGKYTETIKMPEVCDPDDVLLDIYNRTRKTELMKWIVSNAELNEINFRT